MSELTEDYTALVPYYIPISKIGHFSMYVLGEGFPKEAVLNIMLTELWDRWDRLRSPRGDRDRVLKDRTEDTLRRWLEDEPYVFVVKVGDVITNVALWEEVECLHYGVSVGAEVFLWEGVPMRFTREMYKTLYMFGYDYAVVSKFKRVGEYRTKYLKLNRNI